jgi:hypothetical protein
VRGSRDSIAIAIGHWVYSCVLSGVESERRMGLSLCVVACDVNVKRDGHAGSLPRGPPDLSH